MTELTTNIAMKDFVAEQLGEDWRTIVMDSQILTTFQECGEKFDLTFLQNLRPNEPIKPLVKGDVLHVGTEAYYKFLKKELQGEQDRNLIHKNAVEFAIEEARFKATLNGIESEDEEEVIFQLGEYFDFYKDDDLVPIEIEQPFIREIHRSEEHKLRILYAGKIDLVATASRYQWNPVPFDTKSASRNDTPSGRNNQFFGYCDALDVNMLVVNRVGFQSSLSRAERFKRIPLSYPREYRERWRQNTIKWGYKLAWALENNDFDENLSSCDKYSGCIFKKICSSINDEAKEYKKETDYIKVEPWDVTKILGLKKDENEQQSAERIEG